MSGVEENKGAYAATNGPPDDSPPDSPTIANGSGESPPDNPPNPNGSDESAPGANPECEPAPVDQETCTAPGNPQDADGSGEPAPGNPQDADGSGEPAPDDPPNPDGSGSSFEVIPDENADNVVKVATRSSAPGRLETAPFRKRPLFMGGIEVGADGFPVGPYIGLAERMRLEELNNPPDPVRPRELNSSEEEIPRSPSPDDDPNRVPDFKMDTP